MPDGGRRCAAVEIPAISERPRGNVQGARLALRINLKLRVMRRDRMPIVTPQSCFHVYFV